MSYIDEICGALISVLKHAADGPPERFAGYAANREFWVSEAVHCLEVIAGYEERFARMKAASEESRPHKVDWPMKPISEPSMRSGDLSKARDRVREVVQRFLRRCLKIFPDDKFAILKDAKRIGVTVP